jgi:hypothetical protein
MVGARLDNDMNAPDALDRADLRTAYERGRQDERASRRRHPVAMTLTVIAAIIGVVLLALAAFNGSFTRAGGVVDQNLTVAADRAEPAVRDAAADAGQSLRDAGSSVKTKTTENPS